MTRSSPHEAADATIDVRPGGLAVSVHGVLAARDLGSSLAVCLWDPAVRVGGLLHSVHADEDVRLLVARFREAGGHPRRSQAKLVGGASVADGDVDGLGPRNVTAARRRLWTEGITLDAEDVGGTLTRDARLRILDGRVLVSSPARADLIL